MTDLCEVPETLTSLEEHRAMNSFKALFELAMQNPSKAVRVIQKAASDEACYPGHYAAIFLLGMIQGAAGAYTKSYERWIKDLSDGHAEMLEWKPSEFIGAKRKWARGSGI